MVESRTAARATVAQVDVQRAFLAVACGRVMAVHWA